MSDAEAKALARAIEPLVSRGDYKLALALVRPALKKYSTDFYLRYQYAKLLGDWADELPQARQMKFKKEAVAILKPLMRQLRGKPMLIRFGLSLNFYYQSQDWRGMYAFGRRFIRTNKQKALYAQGLAATLLSQDLDSKQPRSSRTWALKAIRSWRHYNFKNEGYYFPHYCFAKALALAGDREEALERLKVAAKHGKRKTSDWEFADVVKILARPQ